MSEGQGGLPQPVFAGRAEQVLMQPQANGRGDASGLVSILVPCCGQIEYTRLCVPRLLKHSRPPFEIIFIDVGSLDGTADFLDGVAATAPVRVEVVSSSAESAFGAAVLEALVRARGAFVAWVNNDVLVPGLWLQQLTGLIVTQPQLGMVGPMSNIAPPQQKVEAVPYRLSVKRPLLGAAETGARGALDTEAVDRFAQEQREKHRGDCFTPERVGGFCFLVKREVLARAPLVDDKADPGAFDAGAFSARVRSAGFRLGACRDLFVHHFGSRLSAG